MASTWSRRRFLDVAACMGIEACATGGAGRTGMRTFDDHGLARLHEAMAGHLQQGVPGIITALGRGGEVHVDVLGSAAVGGAPLKRDSLFRITSMTKPVVAAAALV